MKDRNTQDTPPNLSTLRRSLRRDFGLRRLRPGQERVMRSLLAGRDTLAIMPTGAGKSLCYQLPGLHLVGTTIVVSPLISLMKDQCEKLLELGQPAAHLDSSLTGQEEQEVLRRFAAGELEFLLVTPERLSRPDFRTLAATVTIDVLVVDEAHCVSQWGHDFRPAYLEIGPARAALGDPPLLALTATANQQVIDDVRRHLAAPDLRVVDTGIYRPNLELAVEQVRDDEDRLMRLGELLRDTVGTGIVYTSTVKQCRQVTDHLKGLGIAVEAYHGRLGRAKRHSAQERFMAGELRAVVATNAFGMGIDKSDIRFVVHYNIPGSIDSYYQEAGRAGRDGDPARCLLYYLPSDRNTQIYLLSRSCPRAEDLEAVVTAFGGGTASLAELEKASGKSRRRVRNALAALAELDAVVRLPTGHYRCCDVELTADDVTTIAEAHEARREADRERLERMELYAQTALCRWRHLVEHFGSDGGEVPPSGCSHCDNCAVPVELPPEAPPADVIRGVFPATRTGDLRVGVTAAVPVYGQGTVVAISDGAVTLAFADGEQMRFALPDEARSPAA